MACPPALFQAASNSVADVNVQRDQHLYYSGLLDSMIDAVQWAHEQWRKEAYFSGVRITGMFAHGGQLNGPNLWDLIRRAPTVSGCNGQEARVRDAVAGGVANCFIDWQRTVSVPALPWYPPFLGWPGSFAPQMPNIPSPLSLCSSVQGRSLGDSTSLKDAMKQKLQGNFSYHDVFFGALAKSFAPGFTNWVLQQMVTRVFGYGPVPTYLQPFVIVGPVVGGEILAKPGHLMA